jgi:hypothetical protein
LPAKFAWQKLRENSSIARKVVGQDKHCLYNASSKGMMYDDRRTKLCVGVYDKKRGVLMIREAASRGTVYSLEQTTPTYLVNNELSQSRTVEDILAGGTNVFEDFGSSKKRKVLKSQAANRVEVDHVVGAGEGSAVVQQVTQGKFMSESNRRALAATRNGETDRNRAQESAFEALRRNFLPAYDEDAVKSNKVYDSKNIIGEAGWSKVYNKVYACLHQADPSAAIEGCLGDIERAWVPCALKVVREISPDSTNAGYRYTSAILLNYLIKFYNLSHRRRSISPINEKKAIYFGIPNEVASRWLELFTTTIQNRSGKTTHAMSKANKDKCIVHALILYMISQGPKMKIANIQHISDELKVAVADCGNMLRLAGCTITKKGVVFSASLKTPLTFPPPKQAGGNGRGR